MTRRRFHPGLGSTRSRDPAAIKRSNEREAFVQARLDSHGAEGLMEWLRDNGVLGWGTLDASIALGLIRKHPRCGEAVWRQVIDRAGCV